MKVVAAVLKKLSDMTGSDIEIVPLNFAPDLHPEDTKCGDVVFSSYTKRSYTVLLQKWNSIIVNFLYS